MTLPDTWRLLGPIIAMSGLFTFGWTGSVLVSIMTDFDKFDKLRARRERVEEAKGAKRPTSALVLPIKR